ncbi:MAG: hypothetical protein U0Q15_12325 [Kineosporiaceae bacterium]
MTAPLRRLVDRFGLAVSVAAAAGREVPADIRAALPRLPAAMAAGDRRASALERRCLDVVEAAVLEAHVGGEPLSAVVVAAGGSSCELQLSEPAVLVRCRAPLPLGERVRVRVAAADVATGTVEVVPA